MTVDYKREMRGILLISLLIMVLPLVLFPRDLGLKFASSVPLLFALELCWYALVLFVLFSKAAAPRVFLLALLTLGYRIGLGIGFGFLLLVMFSLALSSSIKMGIYQYPPVLLLHALVSPFVLKPVYRFLIEKTRKSRAAEAGATMSTGKVTEPVPSETVAESGQEAAAIGSTSKEKEPKVAAEEKLENFLHYLKEYAGVKAVILVDHEGLVLAEDSSSDSDPETVATYAKHIKETNDQILDKMGEKASERIGIYTTDAWICLNKIDDLILAVVSDRRTDELLSVRIQQSTGMIKRYFHQKYQDDRLKAVEA
ncbi:MAG: roadblock/LC7 domain-containing protein [Candidatus Zixiibacteriota bacterium]|nr:MAG: roadblock/LC7 domain-containing protein [candidate division Zixibacteria bacterium]